MPATSAGMTANERLGDCANTYAYFSVSPPSTIMSRPVM
jgi:hypothetical protein